MGHSPVVIGIVIRRWFCLLVRGDLFCDSWTCSLTPIKPELSTDKRNTRGKSFSFPFGDRPARPSGLIVAFQSPPPDGFPRRAVRFANCGPLAARTHGRPAKHLYELGRADHLRGHRADSPRGHAILRCWIRACVSGLGGVFVFIGMFEFGCLTHTHSCRPLRQLLQHAFFFRWRHSRLWKFKNISKSS